VQEVDADFLHDAHGRIVNSLEPVVIQRLDRRIDVLRLLPGQLLEPVWPIRRLPCAPPPPPGR